MFLCSGFPACSDVLKADEVMKLTRQKERLANAKRVANACMKAVRAKAMASAKAAKEANWRAKRLTREMQAFWKRQEKAEKIQKRQKEKVAEDQRKVDMQVGDWYIVISHTSNFSFQQKWEDGDARRWGMELENEMG